MTLLLSWWQMPYLSISASSLQAAVASDLSMSARVLQQHLCLQRQCVEKLSVFTLTNNDEPGETQLCGLDLYFQPYSERGYLPATACCLIT